MIFKVQNELSEIKPKTSGFFSSRISKHVYYNQEKGINNLLKFNRTVNKSYSVKKGGQGNIVRQPLFITFSLDSKYNIILSKV